MADLQTSTEKRAHKRYMVQEGSCVAFRPPFSEVGRIMDISATGLSFYYLADETIPTQLDELDIFRHGNGFYLEDVKFETVSDFEIEIYNPAIGHQITARRRGIKFENLSATHKAQLDYFLYHYTTGEA